MASADQVAALQGAVGAVSADLDSFRSKVADLVAQLAAAHAADDSAAVQSAIDALNAEVAKDAPPAAPAQ